MTNVFGGRLRNVLSHACAMKLPKDGAPSPSCQAKGRPTAQSLSSLHRGFWLTTLRYQAPLMMVSGGRHPPSPQTPTSRWPPKRIPQQLRPRPAIIHG
jgi:hypothetical protein